jgi:hypothetical protein
MPVKPIRETTTLEPPSPPSDDAKGTVLREVTRLEEPRPTKPAATPAKP